MDLVVFDLDGTLLNKQQRLSPFTLETLERLKQAGIHYTVATGRTHLAAAACISQHHFPLWQIYKNGVEWWHPTQKQYRHQGILDKHMIASTLSSFAEQEVTPFVFCLEEEGYQTVFHTPLIDRYGESVFKELSKHHNVVLKPMDELPEQAQIINISALGHPAPLNKIVEHCTDHDHVIAYSGGGIYQPDTHWIDIHHNSTCKGSAIERLKEELNATNLVVFGDGDNDLTMFEVANEAYAMDNAPDYIKQKATAAIGHHDQDGVAYFLRDRFGL